MLKNKDDYEIIIRPNPSWFYIDWKGLIDNRDLLLILAKRDLVARYKQTILGPVWFVLQPLLMAIVFFVVFTRFARIGTDQVPPLLFYLSGLVPWTYFAQSLNGTSTTFLTNAGLFGKVYFPRLIAPLSAILSNFFIAIIQLLVFLVFYLFFKFFTVHSANLHPNLLFLLLLPFWFLQASATALGFGLWIAAVTVRFRDFQYLMGFLIQLWMYATPIIYPASLVPHDWRFLIILNPVASVVESFRLAFFGSGQISAISIPISFLILISGILAFHRAERAMVDWI
jgi:homopolymeric O-antigen transport system permease protein